MASGKSFPSGEKEMCKEIFTSLWTELDDGRMSGAMAVTLLPNPGQSINQSICTYIHTYLITLQMAREKGRHLVP